MEGIQYSSAVTARIRVWKSFICGIGLFVALKDGGEFGQWDVAEVFRGGIGVGMWSDEECALVAVGADEQALAFA